MACALPAHAGTLHPAVTVRGANVDFYAGHLVLDAQGGATLDDGVLHVRADRIIVDLANDRFVAAGDVRIADAPTGSPTKDTGAALGVDLTSHDGTLVAISPSLVTYAVTGPLVTPLASPTPAPLASPTPAPLASPTPSPSPSPTATIAGATPTPTPSPSATPTPQPLALVDLQGETPFATASVATAHLGADVRLGSARVLVPGGKAVFLPSYVYTFSSDVGYSQNNVAGSNEDIPIYVGSTRDSITGIHLTYEPQTKVGFGVDHRIVDGDKAYDLFSVSPLLGPVRNAEFTWYDQLNAHASQTLDALTANDVGSVWRYSANDSMHRSYLSLSASNQLSGDFESLTWQGAYEPLGAGWLGQLFNYHVSTQYGRSQPYVIGGPPVYDTAFETLVQAPSLELDPSSSLALSADWRQLFDDSPHRQFAAAYGATVQHRWNGFLTTQLADFENPTVDVYPSQQTGTRTYVSRQVGSVIYGNGEPFAFRIDVTHQAALSAPPGISVQPWAADFDVRFRVSSSLAFELSRSYGFGYFGQRYGPLGFQVFP